MPTLRGWLVVGTGGVSTVVGRFLAAPELERLGLGLIALVVIALVVVRRGRHELRVERKLAPVRPTAGTTMSVTLSIFNDGRGAAPLLLMEDRLPRGVPGRARFVLEGVEPSGQRTAGYEIEPHRRGRLQAGPLTISFLDPFGLARTSSVLTEPSEFLVRPAIERLALPRESGRRRSAASSALRQPVGTTGEDFYTLREYVEGDDLRKVHWASTAKRGRFTIRQEETPWHTRATILLDDRAEKWTGEGGPDAFERAVEVAASLIDLYQRAGYTFRLSCVTGGGLPARKGQGHRDACLDLLATSVPGKDDEKGISSRLGEMAGGTSPESALVVISGSLDPEAALAIGSLTRRWQEVAMICLPPHRWGDTTTRARWGGEKAIVETTNGLARAGVRTIVLGPSEPFAPRWTPARAHDQGGEMTWDLKPERV